MEMSADSYLWICRECKTKGILVGKTLPDLLLARECHAIGSPQCDNGDFLRICTVYEARKNDPAVMSYADWKAGSSKERGGT